MVCIVLTASIVIGCESKTDKQLNLLYEQVNGYLDSGDIVNAVAVFNQMLEIKDDPNIRQKRDHTIEQHLDQMNVQVSDFLNAGNFEGALDILNKMLDINDDPVVIQRIEGVKNEQQALEAIKQLFEELITLTEVIDYAISSDDIMELLEPTKKTINQIEKLELGGESNFSRFVNSFKNNPVYQLYKKDYLSGDSIQTGYDDIITITSKQFRVEMIADSLLEEIIPQLEFIYPESTD